MHARRPAVAPADAPPAAPRVVDIDGRTYEVVWPRLVILVALLELVAASAGAQAWGPMDGWMSPFAAPAAREWANRVSWATVGADVALDAWGSCIDTDDRTRDCLFFAARQGIVFGAVYLMKFVVHRERPCKAFDDCGTDNPDFSFYSAHTAEAFATLVRLACVHRFVLRVTLAVTTGGLRIKAGRHWLSDAVMGAGAGIATSFVRPRSPAACTVI